MREITMAEAIREALQEEMTKDPCMFILGEEIGLRGGAFTCTKGLIEEFPGRVLDTPISESAIAGTAYGAALSGTKVVADLFYSDFTFIAMDQIINSSAKSRYMFGGQAAIPVVFRMSSGSGKQQAAQHSQSLEVLYAHIPGLKVIMPSTPYDAKGLLKAAINDYNPIVFLEPRVLYFKKGEVPEEEYIIPIGKGDIKHKGEDVTVVATGMMVERAITVATKLNREGITVELIDPRTVKPLDTELIISSVRKTGRLVVVHEAPRTYGMAGEIITLVMEQAFDYLNAPPQRVTGHDVPIPYNRNLERLAIPSEEDIEAGVRKALK